MALCSFRPGRVPPATPSAAFSGAILIQLDFRHFSTCKVFRGKSQPWTAAETRRLIELRRQGLSKRQISSELPGRTMAAVELKFHHLACPTTWDEVAHLVLNERHRRRFTAEEDSKLLALYDKGIRGSGLVAQLAPRNYVSIMSRLNKLRGARAVTWDTSKHAHQPYTKQEKEYLLDALVNRNEAYRTVAKKLGRSVQSVEVMYQFLRREMPERRLRSPNACFWTTREIEKLFELRAQGLTDDQIQAELPRRSRQAIRCYVSGSDEARASKHYRKAKSAKDSAEVAALRRAGHDWASIIQKFPDIEPDLLKSRYYYYKRKQRLLESPDRRATP